MPQKLRKFRKEMKTDVKKKKKKRKKKFDFTDHWSKFPWKNFQTSICILIPKSC